VLKDLFLSGEQEMNVLELVVGVQAVFFVGALLFAYFRLSRPDEKELKEVIPNIQSAHMRTMRAVLAQDITRLGDLTPKERKYAERRRLRLIVQWLPKLTNNVALFQSLGRHLNQKASRVVEEWDVVDFKAAEMLRKATLCRFMLVYARFHFAVLMRINAAAWPLTWPAVERSLRLCKAIVDEYRTVERLALRVSASQGRIQYENLWSVL
jgi:hypothetical protein